MKKFCAALESVIPFRVGKQSSHGILLAIGLTLVGCSGSVTTDTNDGDESANGGQGGEGSPVDGVDPGRPKPEVLSTKSLERNPSHPLTCANPMEVSPGPSPLVRLTNTEYRNTLADLFKRVGITTAMPEADLPLEQVVGGFSNNAEGQSPSVSLVEGVESGGVKAAVLAKSNLKALTGFVGCSTAMDEAACTEKLLTGFGKLAFRRPLQTEEVARWKGYFESVKTSGGFDTAVETLVSTMLQAPQFLYRPELGRGALKGGALKLSGYEVASRLSYLLWDTMPDADLFSAAEAGTLDDADGIDKQVARMLGDPRAKTVVADFHKQWLDLGRLRPNGTKKDAASFKGWTEPTGIALFDGLEKWVSEVFWQSQNGTLETLLTDRRAFVNASTAPIYGITEKLGPELVLRDLDDKRSGLLTQAGMLAGLAHDKVHSPILRGVFVLEKLLCAPPPPPPQNVDLNAASPKVGENLSTRDRIVQNVESQARCGGCHKLIDAAGFSMENFDAIGAYRTKEGTFDVNSSASLKDTLDADGDFSGVVPMSQKLGKSQQVAQCLATQWYRFAMARSDEQSDGCNIARVTDAFVNSGGDMKKLLTELTRSDAFRYRSPITH